MRDYRGAPDADGDARVAQGVDSLTPAVRGALDGVEVSVTGTSIQGHPRFADSGGVPWTDNGHDSRDASQVLGAFIGGDSPQLIVAAGADNTAAVVRHEAAHAMDHRLAKRFTPEGEGMFSDSEEFTEFYSDVAGLYDAAGMITNPNYTNTQLLNPYFIHDSLGQGQSNGRAGRSEFFAEAYGQYMDAVRRLEAGEDPGTVHTDVGRALSVLAPDRLGPAADNIRRAGERIVQYFGDLDARASSGPGGRTVTTGVREGTKQIVKHSLDNPDSTKADLLTDEERSALSSALEASYGISPRKLVDNIIEAFRTATPGEREFGSRWYAAANEFARGLSDRFSANGMNAEKSAAVVAALSPRTRWEANKVHAERVMSILADDPLITPDLLDEDITKQGKGMSRAKTQTVGEWMSMMRDIDAAKNGGDALATSPSKRAWVDGIGEGEPRRLSEYTMDEQATLLQYMMTLDRTGGLRYELQATDGSLTGRYHKSAAPIASNLRNAIGIWRAEPGDLQAISAHLGGHKVRSFYNNIVTGGAPDDSITVDTHAMDLAILGALASRFGIKASKTQKADVAKKLARAGLTLPPEGFVRADSFLNLPEWDGVKLTDKGKARKGTYPLFHEAYKRATDEINKSLGTDYSPKQVQAIAWLTALPDSMASAENIWDDAVVEEMRNKLGTVKSMDQIDRNTAYQRLGEERDNRIGESRSTGDWMTARQLKEAEGDPAAPIADTVQPAPPSRSSAPDPFIDDAPQTGPWNDLDTLPDDTRRKLVMYEGRPMEPMPVPGSPEFDSLVEQIREVHPDIKVPTSAHSAAYINPDWRNPDAALIWRAAARKTGRAADGYSPRFEKREKFRRFARVRQILERSEAVRAELKRRAAEGDMTATAALLLQNTGMRVGSTASGTGTSNGQTTYAATSLQPRHIYKHRGSKGYYWKFVGKSAKINTYDVSEPELQELMSQWYTGGSGTERLFPRDVTADAIKELLTELYGMEVLSHDMRRQRATALALELIQRRRSKPRNLTEFKKARREVAQKVGDAINDTHTVAMNNYIDWAVWAEWEDAAGLKRTLILDDSEIPGWEDADMISLDPVPATGGETAETVVASLAEDERHMSPALDMSSPSFQYLVDMYQRIYQTVENPEIAGPDDDPELQ